MGFLLLLGQSVILGLAAAFTPSLLLLGFARLPAVGADDGSPIGAWLRIVAGLVLALAAAFLFRPHPRLKVRVESDIRGYVARASSWVFLGVAFALSIKDLSSFIVLAPALHDIAVAPVSVEEKAVLLVVLYALALSPVLVPPGLRLVFGHRVDGFFRGVYRFTMEHQFQLVGAMATVISAHLLVTGVLRA